MTTSRTLDLDAIEATLEVMPRIPRFPAYFHDMRLLIEEVKRLRAENERLHDIALDYQDKLDTAAEAGG